jgi:cytochrome c oxidase subunit IV
MKAARTILFAWAALLALLALTVAASFAPLGHALPYVSYGIAMAKTAIVAWIFMELRGREGLQRIALAAGFVWLAILFVLLFGDILTRGWLGR